MKKIIIATLCLLLSMSCPGMAQSITAAEFAGGSITYEDAYAQFQSTMQAYADFGWEDDAADPLLVAQQVLEQMVQDAVLRNKAAELGLDRISDDELTRLRAEAEEMYEAQIASYLGLSSDADARAAAEAMLAEDGITPDSILEEMTAGHWHNALYEYVCGDVVADDAFISSYTASLAATQALQFADDPLYFDYLYMNDDLIAYYPEGMRYIKHILIGFDDEQAEEYQRIMTGGGQTAAADALDALYAPLEDMAAHVEQLLMDGAGFDDLMQAYGADEFMLHEPYSAHGYIVQPGSNLFVKEFTDACFALEEIGDISDPVRTSGGLHLILYAGDVPAGPVPIETIAEAAALEAHDQLITDVFDAQVAAWIGEAQPVYHPEYLLQ